MHDCSSTELLLTKSDVGVGKIRLGWHWVSYIMYDEGLVFDSFSPFWMLDKICLHNRGDKGVKSVVVSGLRDTKLCR